MVRVGWLQAVHGTKCLGITDITLRPVDRTLRLSVD